MTALRVCSRQSVRFDEPYCFYFEKHIPMAEGSPTA
jgi:hypothetical protein